MLRGTSLRLPKRGAGLAVSAAVQVRSERKSLTRTTFRITRFHPCLGAAILLLASEPPLLSRLVEGVFGLDKGQIAGMHL